MIRAGAALLACGILSAACADEPPPRPRQAHKAAVDADGPRHAARPRPPRPVDRSAEIAASLKVDSADLTWSPSHTVFVVALAPEPAAGEADADPRAATPRAPHRLVAYDAGGDKRGEFEALRPGPISELRFLDDERLVYLVPPPPPPPAARSGRHGKPRRKGARRGAPPAAARTATGTKAAAAAARPTTMYAIQPLRQGAPPVMCEGRRFVFSPKGDHLAWVAGEPAREYVAADGAQVYPRDGVTTIQNEPAWSNDGVSLALIEGGDSPRLVVLVEFDNPSGDNSWPLPPAAIDPSLRVYWAGASRLVVGHDLTKPVFATSFTRAAPPAATTAE
jgi:hypothetical protein